MAIILGPTIEDDEWNTGLTPADSDHYFNKDEFLHTGIFRNQDIIERRRQFITENSNSNRNKKSIIKKIGNTLDKLLDPDIFLRFFLVFAVFTFMVGMFIMINHESPKKPDSSVTVEKSISDENDKYGNNNVY